MVKLGTFTTNPCQVWSLAEPSGYNSAMIKNLEIYRRRAEAQRWGALRSMSAEESIAIGEALLTSEILKLAWTGNRRRPKCLAVALGIRQRWDTPREKSVARSTGLPQARKRKNREDSPRTKAG